MGIRSFDDRTGLSRPALLAVAGGMWLVVGVALAGLGAFFLGRSGRPESLPWIPVAVAVGWAKSRFVLRPMAVRNVRRILDGPARRPLPAVYAPRVWALVGGFMALGAILRRSPLPRDWVGLVYLAVGLALTLASGVALTAANRESARGGTPAR